MKKAVEILGNIATYGESEDGYEVECFLRDQFSPKELQDIALEISEAVNSEMIFDV